MPGTNGGTEKLPNSWYIIGIAKERVARIGVIDAAGNEHRVGLTPSGAFFYSVGGSAARITPETIVAYGTDGTRIDRMSLVG